LGTLQRRAPQVRTERLQRTDDLEIGQVGQCVSTLQAVAVLEEHQLSAVITVKDPHAPLWSSL
jgi:hypothetical protein